MSEKMKWLIGPIITVIIVASGVIASWATTKAVMLEMQKNQARIEKNVEDLENKVHEIELKSAVDSSILQSLKEDIAIIKQDVKKILEGRK